MQRYLCDRVGILKTCSHQDCDSITLAKQYSKTLAGFGNSNVRSFVRGFENTNPENKTSQFHLTGST